MSLTIARFWVAVLHHLRREAPLTLAYAEATMAIATEQGFPQPFAQATPLRGWAPVGTGRRGERRSCRVSSPTERQGQWCTDRITWPCSPRCLPRWNTSPRTGGAGRGAGDAR